MTFKFKYYILGVFTVDGYFFIFIDRRHYQRRRTMIFKYIKTNYCNFEFSDGFSWTYLNTLQRMKEEK
jgi:hypothetical protein